MPVRVPFRSKEGKVPQNIELQPVILPTQGAIQIPVQADYDHRPMRRAAYDAYEVKQPMHPGTAAAFALLGMITIAVVAGLIIMTGGYAMCNSGSVCAEKVHANIELDRKAEEHRELLANNERIDDYEFRKRDYDQADTAQANEAKIRQSQIDSDERVALAKEETKKKISGDDKFARVARANAEAGFGSNMADGGINAVPSPVVVAPAPAPAPAPVFYVAPPAPTRVISLGGTYHPDEVAHDFGNGKCARYGRAGNVVIDPVRGRVCQVPKS